MRRCFDRYNKQLEEHFSGLSWADKKTAQLFRIYYASGALQVTYTPPRLAQVAAWSPIYAAAKMRIVSRSFQELMLRTFKRD